MDTTTDVSLSPQKQQKLDQLVEEMHAKSTIDYTNEEMKDIESAVHEMLWKIAERINLHGDFKISRLQACGSMAERESVWKHLKRGEECEGLEADDVYIEFDFLPLLGEFNEGNTKDVCPECADVKLSELFKHIRTREKLLYDTSDFKQQFFNEGIASAESLFECILPDIKYAANAEINVSFKHNASVCECCVIRATGALQLSTSIPIKLRNACQTPANCSLILQWTSKSGSLYVPNISFTHTQQIKTLPIFIDFLPAFESQGSQMTDSGYEYKTFLIPKSCNCCAISSPVCWKKSMCLSEIHTIANEMTDKHRKCYRLIKLLFELVDDTVYYRSYFNQYSVKTVVLHHSRQCLDTSDECANCVLHIFRELQLAHETRRLRSFHSNQMLNGQWILGRILQEYTEKLCSVSTTDSLDMFVRKIAAGSS